LEQSSKQLAFGRTKDFTAEDVEKTKGVFRLRFYQFAAATYKSYPTVLFAIFDQFAVRFQVG
jgi:hypothetical protein